MSFAWTNDRPPLRVSLASMPDELDALGLDLAIEEIELRHLGLARNAPGRPEVDDDDLAFVVGQPEIAAVEQRSANGAYGLSIRNRDRVALGGGADEPILATRLLVDGVLAARACGDGQAGGNHSSQSGKKPIAGAAAALLGRRPHGASSVRYEPEWHCRGPTTNRYTASRSGDGSGRCRARGLGVIDAHHDIARKSQRGYRSSAHWRRRGSWASGRPST